MVDELLHLLTHLCTAVIASDPETPVRLKTARFYDRFTEYAAVAVAVFALSRALDDGFKECTIGASRPSTSNGKGPSTTDVDGPAGQLGGAFVQALLERS